MKVSKLTLCTMLVLAAAPLVLAQGTYTEIDYPGATGTIASNVDKAGDIIGLWTDSNYNNHGFLLSNGAYTPIDYPGAQGTITSGINDKGKIVGYALPSQVGFIYDTATKKFTTLSDPQATGTLPSSINNSGVIAGIVFTSSGSYVFALVGTTYHLIPPPQALQGGSFEVAGITASNAIVVAGETSSGTDVAYAYYKGTYTQIPLPAKNQLNVFGVNPQGYALVGAYQVSTFVTAGFLYDSSAFRSLQFPDSEDTNAEGINRSGEVVGVFTTNGLTHGFTWTPPAAD